MREVPDNVIDRSSPLNEVDSTYLIQEIHRFIGQSKKSMNSNEEQSHGVRKSKKKKRSKDSARKRRRRVTSPFRANFDYGERERRLKEDE